MYLMKLEITDDSTTERTVPVDGGSSCSCCTCSSCCCNAN